MNLLSGAYPSAVMCLNNSAKTPYMFPDCECILSPTTKLWTFFSISIQLIPISFDTPISLILLIVLALSFHLPSEEYILDNKTYGTRLSRATKNN